MGLSAAAADAHIARWTEELGRNPFYPHRVRWPALLFHHAPVENAAQIITEGQLCSRLATDHRRPRDVAGAGVIDHRHRAHEFTRLYFRPRTPTQYHIEGIRRPAECSYGPDAHAPILTMFMFDARSILTMPTTRFSDINMQRDNARDGDNEAFFNTIDFAKVYQEGNFGGDASITHHRAAEVLCQSPLLLAHSLKWIFCRSDAERETLIHMAGLAGQVLRRQIITSDDGKVFEKRFAFVERVYASPEGVTFQINPRFDQAPLKVRVQVQEEGHALNFDETYNQLPARAANGGPWISRVVLADGVHRVTIHIDDKLAYENLLFVGEALF